MTPMVDGGLAATAANDGVAATTTTSRLRAAVAERVMATVAGSGVAATKATSRLQAAAAEQAMALAFDGGVAATVAGNGAQQQPPTGTGGGACEGVSRTPNRNDTCTTLRRGLRRRHGVASLLELSFDDGGVAEQR